MARCLIGCGSNIGRRREQLDRAFELLRFMPGIDLVRVSRYRETKPIGGPVGQPPFLNGACLLETDLTPHELMGMLAAVENTLHRERIDRWGPRSIDLDLLIYDDVVMESEVLTLPHPRMSTRRFVLEPAAEIAADMEHPLARCSLEELLDNISQPRLHVAVAGVPGSGAPEVAAAIADAAIARLIHAPAPLPPSSPSPRDSDRGMADEWPAALESCAAALAVDGWPADPHVTVADFWLETLRLAAADALSAADHVRFEAEFQQAAAGTVAPHVVVLLHVPPEVLEERVAFRSRRAVPATDLFADLPAATACASPRQSVAPLVRLQERLVCRLQRRPEASLAAAPPRAVVQIDASDLVRATEEAVAAVEAMA
ncbi:MAG: 2-amino-4-hydroxy-6-hydroxymethyldihydropteridine diphosphokinase [Planctomycetia bacterium]|nr:2-amino-4-hydroxy-6-hydroxymethyldihydropteridine diphosphokinase [Planctomycetia bacterium]